MRRVLLLTALGATLAGGLPTSASAAPVGAGTAGALRSEASIAEPVDYRSYRHCHRTRSGKRWCHGPHYRYRYYGYPYGYYGYYPYYYTPGFSLYVGPRYKYRYYVPRHRPPVHHPRRR